MSLQNPTRPVILLFATQLLVGMNAGNRALLDGIDSADSALLWNALSIVPAAGFLLGRLEREHAEQFRLPRLAMALASACVPLGFFLFYAHPDVPAAGATYCLLAGAVGALAFHAGRHAHLPGSRPGWLEPRRTLRVLYAGVGTWSVVALIATSSLGSGSVLTSRGQGVLNLGGNDFFMSTPHGVSSRGTAQFLDGPEWIGTHPDDWNPLAGFLSTEDHFRVLAGPLGRLRYSD